MDDVPCRDGPFHRANSVGRVCVNCGLILSQRVTAGLVVRIGRRRCGDPSPVPLIPIHSRQGKGKKLNGNERQRKIARLSARDGGGCYWCGVAFREGFEETIDHLEPRSKGGTNDDSNCVLACKGCNNKRGNDDFASYCASKGISPSAMLPGRGGSAVRQDA